MKKILLVVIILLVGCGSASALENVDGHIEKIDEHTERFMYQNGDTEQLKKDIEEFNEYLHSIDESEYREYVEVQLEANELKLEGLTNRDPDTITDSALKQAEAKQILNNLKES